jgi:hypothetical protein
MSEDEAIQQRVEFLKLEYGQLIQQVTHLENLEWRIRQTSITLWLASLAVGLGFQGRAYDLNLLIASAIVPCIFLYFDARIYRWISFTKSRRKQVEFFLSEKEYVLPSSGEKISFIEFCTDKEGMYKFPVLDFSGRLTMGNDPHFLIETGATYPYMAVGLRRFFYYTQFIASLIFISQNLSTKYNNRLFWLLPLSSLVIHFTLLLASKIREKRIRKHAVAMRRSMSKNSIQESGPKEV